MKSLTIAPLALASVLAFGIQSNAMAFMAVEVEQPLLIASELSELVDSLHAEVAAGETPCEELLAKLDDALDRIDAKLDQGVVNEDEYLAARDEISSLKYDLECVTKKATNLAQFVGPVGALGPSSITPTNVDQGRGFTGGSGGPGSMSGGGLSGLLPLGILGGTIAATADDDNKPGVNNCTAVTQ